MKLVPFILNQKKVNTFTITSCNLFLSHAGKAIWKIDEPDTISKEMILKEYLEPNGFSVKKMFFDSSSRAMFVQIDAEKTKLSDFYSWEEALKNSSKPECWRTFYFIQDKEGADWWSPQGMIEAELHDFGNVGKLFEIIQLCI